MAHHDAVSCDACMKSSFSGNRYKCLICYDYDLCASCYEAGATSAQHLAQHPMQCVLARADYELYYAGEDSSKAHQPRSFTCPFCGRMGFSDASLNTHVNSDHAEDSFEVVCPVCAATQGGDPNRVTEDFIAHLMLEHRGTAHDFDEAQAVMTTASEHQATHHVVAGGMRGFGRMHREAYQYHSPSSAVSSLSPSAGQDSETIDSMSELLYQLTAIKGRGSTIQSISSQLQQLELQLQTTRHQLEGLPVRQSQQQQAVSRQQQQQQQQQGPGESSRVIMLTHGVPVTTTHVHGLSSVATGAQTAELKAKTNTQYLLSRLDEAETSESEKEKSEEQSADKALFVQELVLTMLVEDLTSKGSTSKQGTQTSLPESAAAAAAPKCNPPPVLPLGHQIKSTCDRKPVSMTHKEIVTREISLAHGGVGGIVNPQQSHDRMEMHVHKTRLHPPQKTIKHKSGRELLPPKK